MLVSWRVSEVVCSLEANPAWESVYLTKVLSADLGISSKAVCVCGGSAQGLHDEGKVAETAKWDSSFQEVMGEFVKQQLTPAEKVLAAGFIGQHLTMEEKLSRHMK